MLASEKDDERLRVLRYSLASEIVELVVLTADELFLSTLRDAVGSDRRLWHVPSPDKVSDLLVAGGVGIVVIDVQTLQDAAQLFVSRIKQQFPDLVVIVAGSRESEVALSALISSGEVYRFIHKPMSPARAKLFVEAAVKRYDDQRQRAIEFSYPARSAPRRRGRMLIAIGGALVLSAAGYWWHRSPPSPSEQALAQPPPPRRDADGSIEAREHLATLAENALLEEHFDAAAAAIEAARRGGVEPGRIALLSARLSKARELSRAIQIAQRPHNEPPAAADKVAPWLALAAQRLSEGKVIEPGQDSAKYYILQALAADPDNESGLDAKRALALRVLNDARAAIDRHDFVHAAALLGGADGIAAPANIAATQSLLAAARTQAARDFSAQLLKNATERLQQDRLVEPGNDSAMYYLGNLRQLDASYPGSAAAMQDLGVRLIAKARAALNLSQYETANGWLQAADAAGVASEERASLQNEVTAGMAKQALMAQVLPYDQFTVLKSPPPAYPAKAQRTGAEGWVELDFTVTETGSVTDIAVHAASPPGLFEDAASKALEQWRFAPLLRDAKPTAARTRVRMRFALT